MRLYIAGPMKGYEGHNWPAFYTEEELLIQAGYEVVNPARLNGTYEEALAKTYKVCLTNDLKHLLDCDGVATLSGWEKSRGATLECYVARALEMPVRPAEEWREMMALPIRAVAHQLHFSIPGAWEESHPFVYGSLGTCSRCGRPQRDQIHNGSLA